MAVLAEQVPVTQAAGTPFPPVPELEAGCECGLPSDDHCFAMHKIGLPHYQLPDHGLYYGITPVQRSHLCLNSSLLKYVFNDREFKRGKFLNQTLWGLFKPFSISLFHYHLDVKLWRKEDMSTLPVSSWGILLWKQNEMTDVQTCWIVKLSGYKRHYFILKYFRG